MEYTMYPVVDIYHLSDVLALQYDWDWDARELCEMLVGDHYINDSYMRFDYDEICEDEPEVIKCTKAYLKDVLPDYSVLLIDVSW